MISLSPDLFGVIVGYEWDCQGVIPEHHNPDIFEGHFESLSEATETDYYQCDRCKRFVPWWFGGDQGLPNSCDDCWSLAYHHEIDVIEGAVATAKLMHSEGYADKLRDRLMREFDIKTGGYQKPHVFLRA